MNWLLHVLGLFVSSGGSLGELGLWSCFPVVILSWRGQHKIYNLQIAHFPTFAFAPDAPHIWRSTHFALHFQMSKSVNFRRQSRCSNALISCNGETLLPLKPYVWIAGVRNRWKEKDRLKTTEDPNYYRRIALFWQVKLHDTYITFFTHRKNWAK